MTPAPYLLLGLAVLGLAASIGYALRLGRQRARSLEVNEVAYPGLAWLRSATLLSRRVGLLLGLLACVAVVPLGYLGRLALTGPAVAAMVAIAAILVGQHSAHEAARTPGVAGLERRSWTDYPARRALGELTGLLAAVGVVAAWTTLAASPDDLGRAGRSVTTVCTTTVPSEGVASVETVTHSSSPFPGSFYTAPMAIALGLLALVVLLALISIGRRPRNGSDPELVRVDDALRRITAEGVLGAASLGLAGSLLLVSASAYLQLGKSACEPSGIIATSLFGVAALVALVCCLRNVVTVLVPGDGSPS